MFWNFFKAVILGRCVVRWVAGCPINLRIVAFIFADFETSGSTCRRCSIGCTAWRSRQWPSSQATRLPAARCWPQPATSGSWSTIPSSLLGSMRWGHYFRVPTYLHTGSAIQSKSSQKLSVLGDLGSKLCLSPEKWCSRKCDRKLCITD